MTGLYSFATLRCVYIVSAKRFISKAFIKCVKTLMQLMKAFAVETFALTTYAHLWFNAQQIYYCSLNVFYPVHVCAYCACFRGDTGVGGKFPGILES